MFDLNEFKHKIKEWIQEHPDATEQELKDRVDELIPINAFATHRWLSEQTTSWYRHILQNRRAGSE